MPAYGKNKAALSAVSHGSSSRKRKLDSDKNMQKYYAVRAGYNPGIYLTWSECQSQIAGFKGAQYKSFFSRDDAMAFVAGKNPEGAGTKDKGERFYAVAVGNAPGVYTDWESASLAIVGAKGPKYKKFGTRAEATQFIRTFGNAAAQEVLDEDEEDDDEDDDDDDDDDDEDEDDEAAQPPVKKAKTKTAHGLPAILEIYTDGSSRGNGRAGAAAGVGVFFGTGDHRNISERLQGQPQTNQRAELTAILRALQTAPKTQSVRIFSDSKYSISCVSEWYKAWIKNGWKTQNGDVQNQDLVKGIRKLIDARDKAGSETLFTWVKGHASDAGNVAADQLAVQGSRLRA